MQKSVLREVLLRLLTVFNAFSVHIISVNLVLVWYCRLHVVKLFLTEEEEKVLFNFFAMKQTSTKEFPAVV